MFGPIGALTKGAAIFLHAGDGQPPSEKSDEQKRSPVFSGKIGSAAPVEGPHIFSEKGPAESKSGPDNLTEIKGPTGTQNSQYSSHIL